MKQFLKVQSGVAKPQSWSDKYYTYVLLSQEETIANHENSTSNEPDVIYICDYVQYTHEEFEQLMTKDLKQKVLTELDQSLDVVKYNKIIESKKLLDMYYSTHPLVSTVHNPDGEKYAVTAEKQTHLMAMITLHDQSQELGVAFQPTWNATGEPCEPWTALELKQLALEIAQFVYPAVSKQQTYEKQIVNMTTVEDVKGLVINYETA